VGISAEFSCVSSIAVRADRTFSARCPAEGGAVRRPKTAPTATTRSIGGHLVRLLTAYQHWEFWPPSTVIRCCLVSYGAERYFMANMWHIQAPFIATSGGYSRPNPM